MTPHCWAPPGQQQENFPPSEKEEMMVATLRNDQGEMRLPRMAALIIPYSPQHPWGFIPRHSVGQRLLQLWAVPQPHWLCLQRLQAVPTWLHLPWNAGKASTEPWGCGTHPIPTLALAESSSGFGRA